VPTEPVSASATPPDLATLVRGEAENRPGVYRFLGPRGELLYAGKSVRVRDRLLSWLRAREGKALELLRVTRHLEWDYVASEFEALLLELRTIRTKRPRFNVVHRRDRRFAWVRLTGEPAPRLVATLDPGAGSTRRGARRGERLFGPFPAHRSLPRALRELASATGLRDCAGNTPIHFADQVDLLGVLLPPQLAPLCPRAELGTCPAPCAALCTEASYAERVREAVSFLEGDGDAPLERLTARMEAASERQSFEVAARLRDRIERLVGLRRTMVETATEIASLTFVYHPPSAHPGALPRHFLLREGQILLAFDPPPPRDPDARARAAGTVARAFDVPGVPSARLDAGAREELFLATRWFRLHPGERAQTTPVPRYLARLDQGRARGRGRRQRPVAGASRDAAGDLSPSAAPSCG
jgi:excinuclease ABC subunit C